jgi:hypothetical protein
MILRNALCIVFEGHEQFDLSLNTRLALGITEKEMHPVECINRGEDWIG